MCSQTNEQMFQYLALFIPKRRYNDNVILNELGEMSILCLVHGKTKKCIFLLPESMLLTMLMRLV